MHSEYSRLIFVGNTYNFVDFSLNIHVPPYLSDAGVASANSPMVIGSSKGCVGFMGYFDEVIASLLNLETLE